MELYQKQGKLGNILLKQNGEQIRKERNLGKIRKENVLE